jgi:hypothetical protein
MITEKEICELVEQVTYKPNWAIKVGGDFLQGMFLQVYVVGGVCSVTGDSVDWCGGKKYLSKHMCKQEIIGACFAIIKAAEEHEMLEHFRYKGASIFNPHLDPDKLVEVARKKSSFICRPNNESMDMEK